MRLLTYILLLGLLAGHIKAQTVEIPDDAFRNCLMAKAPTAFDINEQLILSEAPNITGFLNCSGDEILSVEGFQYLTGINEVDLSRNHIAFINLPVSTNLSRLILDDNQLTHLNDLSDVPNLKTLVVKRNELVQLPDLSTNTALQQLYVQGNNLTAVPDLLNQKKLWAINVSDNQLTTLPKLDSLKELIELVVADNQLVSMQSLENLDSLKVLDISGNKFTALPDFNTVNKISLIDMERNDFTVLPDFTVFPNLVSAFLNDNYFTFTDLVQLTSIPDYGIKFNINSQQSVEVGQDHEVREGDELVLSTGVDQGINDVTYTWYLEGDELQQNTLDNLVALTDSSKFTGYYFCELTHPYFPNLTLKTDSFFVNVVPCFELDEFVIEVTPKTCKSNGGKVVVATSSSLPVGFQYFLVATYSRDSMISSEGVFSSLGEEQYQLLGNVDNCQKVIGETIVIKEEDCNNAYISADGDGIDDFYYFTDTGRVNISDKFGNSVTSFTIPGKWDGNGEGKLVTPGLYYADINNGEKLIKITVVY